ncbi:MAG: tRNA (adenine(22)-N(1))-methyltransferase TrmK [Dehalococcoidia bacterium]
MSNSRYSQRLYIINHIAEYLTDLHEKINEQFEVTILGKRFIVCPGVFSPIGTSSEFLSSNLLINHGDTVLDLGTGVGIQAVIAAEKAKKVVATDINKEALVCAKMNVENNYLADKVEIRYGDLLEPIGDGEQFDVIIWSPPFLPLSPCRVLDKGWCCGNNDDLIMRFFAHVKNHLTSNGRIEIFYSTLGNMAYLLSKATSAGFNVSLVATHIIPEHPEKLLVLLFQVENQNN